MTTISIVPVMGYPAILMLWENDIRPADISRAYQDITRHLNSTTTVQYVVVDLSRNPRMPLAETLRGALFGPYNHPNLKQWLVVGEHKIGRMVASILKSTTGKSLVMWFENLQDAYTHIENEQALLSNK